MNKIHKLYILFSINWFKEKVIYIVIIYMQRESTINIYKATLKKYKTLNFDKPQEVLSKLKEMKTKNDTPLSTSYIKGILCAIIWKLKQSKNKTKQLEEYRSIISRLRGQLERDERNHKNIHGVIPLWSDIIKKREEVKGKDDLGHLILSLYTYISPRRLCDYVILTYTKKKTNITELNYYVENEQALVFNKYKTSKKYGQHTIHIPDELNDIIKAYIDKHEIREGELILHVHDYHGINYKLNKLLGCSIDNIRHSYVNNFYKNYQVPDSSTLSQLALDMGHSIETNLNYRKY